MQDALMKDAYELHRVGRIDEAARLYGEVLRANPRHFEALYSLGLAHVQRGRPDEGERLMGEAVSVNPRAAEAWYGRGCVLHQLQRLDDAIACYDGALGVKPDYIEALNNRGAALAALGRYDQALASLDRVLAARPNDAQALNNRGNALLQLGRPAEALASYDRPLSVNPGAADVHCNRGAALMALGRGNEALASFDRALGLAPHSAEVLTQRGVLLMQLGRLDDAVANFSRALALDPDRPDLLYHRGNALAQLRRFEEAVPDFDRALARDPANPDLLYSRSNALDVLKRYEDAIRDGEAVLAIDPDYRYARGILLHARLQICDWRDLEEEGAKIANALRAGKRVLSPFDNGAISQSPEEQLLCARLWTADICPAAPEPVWRGEIYRHDKIRLAYLSSDYRLHPVAIQMAGVFEAHDRARFETIAVSFTPEHQSPFRTRLEKAFSRFVDVRGQSDLEVARLLKAWEIDIAVDLNGWTRECRTGIFAQRPAPIQVNYLGYSGTMGADYYDYVVADAIAVPEAHEPFFVEKVVRLPDSFMPNDATRASIDRKPTRAEAGLPPEGFVFCCFNGSYKIGPQIFDVWMRLLRAVEGSVLWLAQANAPATLHLRREAQARGVPPERIVFAPFVPAAEDHLARLALADIFLDTLPYGAHSTTSDALWMGLPVLTCLGNTFAGRVAASQLAAAGLPELVTRDLEAYEALALRLARDPALLSDIRARLAQNRGTCALFDTQRFCRHLERAYMIMCERYRRGEPPLSFAVAADD